MSGEREISEADLHAFVDGALDTARLRELEAKIDADPVVAQRVAAFRSDKEMLKRVYAPLIDRPIPEEWLAIARRSTPPARRAMSWRLVGSIAAVVTLFVAGMIAYRDMRPSRPGEIVQVALDAREQAINAGNDITVQAGANTAQYDAALSATVASHVKAPDLGRMGYRLAAIRLYPKTSGNGAAELFYRDDSNRLFTLYLRRSGGVARFDQFERNGLRICVWQDEELSTVMAGDVSTAAMQRLASLAYTGLTL